MNAMSVRSENIIRIHFSNACTFPVRRNFPLQRNYDESNGEKKGTTSKRKMINCCLKELTVQYRLHYVLSSHENDLSFNLT